MIEPDLATHARVPGRPMPPRRPPYLRRRAARASADQSFNRVTRRRRGLDQRHRAAARERRAPATRCCAAARAPAPRRFEHALREVATEPWRASSRATARAPPSSSRSRCAGARSDARGRARRRGGSRTRCWSRRRSSAATRTGAGSSRRSAPAACALRLPRTTRAAGGRRRCSGPAPRPDPPRAAGRAARLVRRRRSTIEVDLGARPRPRAACWTCDLSYDYVQINAEYTT